MDCLYAMAPNEEDLLKFALDEEPLPEEASKHLEQCAVCQQRLARYKQVNSSLIAYLYRCQCPTGTQLSLYCADLLPADKRVSIAAHLLDCPLCAAEASETRRFMAEVKPEPAPLFSASAAIRRIIGTPARPQAQLALRGSNGSSAPEPVWPRQYHAESIDLSLHLTRGRGEDYMLLGILTSSDPEESIDAFEGAKAELYLAPGPLALEGDAQGETPLLRTLVDDLGNLVFSTVPAGQYVLVVHLPGRELIVEGLGIK